MSKMIIPEVEIEIGDNLYIQIKDVSFIPFKAGYISGRPEDCYPEEPAECDWKNENAKLVIKKQILTGWETENDISVRKAITRTDEKEFDVDDSFVYEYYNQIISQVEEDLQSDR